MVENALFMIGYENIYHKKIDIMHTWTYGKVEKMYILHNLPDYVNLGRRFPFTPCVPIIKQGGKEHEKEIFSQERPLSSASSTDRKSH